ATPDQPDDEEPEDVETASEPDEPAADVVAVSSEDDEPGVTAENATPEAGDSANGGDAPSRWYPYDQTAEEFDSPDAVTNRDRPNGDGELRERGE
ncbi:hypothetical protein, partial [Kribbella antibiotica]|uniref:hypothetical protein n=1 Tax=Kribbella antibiotica TaxID=190195 RepID=UPI001EDFB7A2